MSKFREEIIGDCRKRTDGSTAIYALCEEDGSPRYVGKTDYYLHVRHKAHIRAAARPRLPVHRWLRKRVAGGHRAVIRLLEYVPAGADWAAAERRWIAAYRSQGCDLLNLTDGGEGQAGLPKSEAARAAISKALKTGATFACETCGAEFWRKRNEIERGNCRFCSRACYSSSLKGVSRPVPAICTEHGVRAAAAAKLARSACRNGHGWTQETTRKNTRGARVCRVCEREAKRRYRERNRG